MASQGHVGEATAPGALQQHGMASADQSRAVTAGSVAAPPSSPRDGATLAPHDGPRRDGQPAAGLGDASNDVSAADTSLDTPLAPKVLFARMGSTPGVRVSTAPGYARASTAPGPFSPGHPRVATPYSPGGCRPGTSAAASVTEFARHQSESVAHVRAQSPSGSASWFGATITDASTMVVERPPTPKGYATRMMAVSVKDLRARHSQKWTDRSPVATWKIPDFNQLDKAKDRLAPMPRFLYRHASRMRHLEEMDEVARHRTVDPFAEKKEKKVVRARKRGRSVKRKPMPGFADARLTPIQTLHLQMVRQQRKSLMEMRQRGIEERKAKQEEYERRSRVAEEAKQAKIKAQRRRAAQAARRASAASRRRSRRGSRVSVSAGSDNAGAQATARSRASSAASGSEPSPDTARTAKTSASRRTAGSATKDGVDPGAAPTSLGAAQGGPDTPVYSVAKRALSRADSRLSLRSGQSPSRGTPSKLPSASPPASPLDGRASTVEHNIWSPSSTTSLGTGEAADTPAPDDGAGDAGDAPASTREGTASPGGSSPRTQASGGSGAGSHTATVTFPDSASSKAGSRRRRLSRGSRRSRGSRGTRRSFVSGDWTQTGRSSRSGGSLSRGMTPLQQSMMKPVAAAPMGRVQCPKPEVELRVMRLVLVREGYLQQLKGLAEVSRSKRVEPVELHSVVDLLRAATLDVTEAVAKWRACLVKRCPFIWSGLNYLLKITCDTDFMDGLPRYLYDEFPWRLRRNPLMLPLDLLSRAARRTYTRSGRRSRVVGSRGGAFSRVGDEAGLGGTGNDDEAGGHEDEASRDAADVGNGGGAAGVEPPAGSGGDAPVAEGSSAHREESSAAVIPPAGTDGDGEGMPEAPGEVSPHVGSGGGAATSSPMHPSMGTESVAAAPAAMDAAPAGNSVELGQPHAACDDNGSDGPAHTFPRLAEAEPSRATTPASATSSRAHTASPSAEPVAVQYTDPVNPPPPMVHQRPVAHTNPARLASFGIAPATLLEEPGLGRVVACLRALRDEEKEWGKVEMDEAGRMIMAKYRQAHFWAETHGAHPGTEMWVSH